MRICQKHGTNSDEPSAEPYERDTGRADMDVTTPLDSPGSPVADSSASGAPIAPALPTTDEVSHSDQLALLPDSTEAAEAEQSRLGPDLSDETEAVSGTTLVAAIDEVCANARGSAPTPTTSGAVPPAPIITLSPSLHSVASWVSDDVHVQEPLGPGGSGEDPGSEEEGGPQQHEPCAVGYQRIANEQHENDQLQQQQQQQQQHGEQECDVRSLPEDAPSSTGLQPLSAPESRILYGVEEGSPSADAGADGVAVTVTMGNPLFMVDAAAAAAAATSSSRPHSRRRLSFSTAVDNPCFSFSEDGECSATHCRQERRVGSEAGEDSHGHQVEPGGGAEERLEVQGEDLAEEEVEKEPKAAEDEEEGPKDGLREQAATAAQEGGVELRKGKDDGLQDPTGYHSWEEWATVGDDSGCMGSRQQPAPSRPSTSGSSPPKVFATLPGQAHDDGACDLAAEELPPTPQLEAAPATPATPTTPITPDKLPPPCAGPLTPPTMPALTTAAEPLPQPPLSATLRRCSSSPHPRDAGHLPLSPAPSLLPPPHSAAAAATPASAKRAGSNRTSCDSTSTMTPTARRGSTARSGPFTASAAGSRPPWRPAAAAPSTLTPASSLSRTGHVADPSPSSKPNAFPPSPRSSRCNLPRSASGPPTLASLLQAHAAKPPGSAASVGPVKPPFRPASKYATLPLQPPSPTPSATTALGAAIAATSPAAAGRTRSSRASAALRASADWLRLPSFMRPTSTSLVSAAASAAAASSPGSAASVKSGSSKSKGGVMLAGLLSAVGVGKKKNKARRKEVAKEASASWSASMFAKPHWR